jgi:hypothetical protein
MPLLTSAPPYRTETTRLTTGTYLVRVLSYVTMPDSNQTRATFIDRVLTSHLPGEVAKRFRFADAEVAALYTLGRKTLAGLAQPIVLFVATFPPDLTQAGMHDFGIDYVEQPVAPTEEAHDLLAQFDEMQAQHYSALTAVLLKPKTLT